DLIRARGTEGFSYDLRYTLKGGALSVRVLNSRVTANTGQEGAPKSPFVSRDGVLIDGFSFSVTEGGKERRVAKKDIPRYLPRYVVTYYSGVSNRMEQHFFEPQLEFRDELLAGNVIPLRPLFYAKPIHSQFAL